MQSRLAFILMLAGLTFLAIGYMWMNNPTSRDFNFGPPILIMLGGVLLLFGLIVMIASRKNRK